MPLLRDTSYGAFNFLVEMETGQGTEVLAGFSDISGLSAEGAVTGYRPGNSRLSSAIQLPRTRKAGAVTLRRGIISSQNLYDWLKSGTAGGTKRNFVIRLLSEDRKRYVVSWKLIGTLPLKWTGPTLNADGGGDVAIEELQLSIETLELVTQG